jgi:exopolysaccharide biosynthesis protein
MVCKNDIMDTVFRIRRVNSSRRVDLLWLPLCVVILGAVVAIFNFSTSVTPTVLGQTTPTNGYIKMTVSSEGKNFTVAVVAADLNTTRVIVDTASEGDCRDNCPVLPLATYAKRSGAYAGINGSYFCPATYPTCVGKKNAFDTLLMNKAKRYFNSDNNVYSQVPAVIFSGNSARFVNASQEWGRDTGVDAVIANYPLLTFNNSVRVAGTNDPKHTARGPRGFVGATGSTAYIGVVYNATVTEAAKVLLVMGIHNSMNLDSGGSTALWYGGYKAGPGRSVPNAILFVKR